MKLTWPRFFLAFFIAAVVIAIPVALHAEDGQAESQVARQIRAPQTLFAASQTSSTLTAEQIAPAVPECELTHSCAPVPPPAVIVPPANDNSGTVLNVMPTIDRLAEVVGILLASIITTILGQVMGLLPGPLKDWLKKSTMVQDTLHDIGKTDYAKKFIGIALRYVLDVGGYHMDDLGNVDVRNSVVKDIALWIQDQEPELMTWIKTSGSVPKFIAPIVSQIAKDQKPANANIPAAIPVAA